MPTYVNPFGGQPASPAYVAYRAVSLSANLTLFWPWNNNNSTNITARLMNVTPTSGGFIITLPSAAQAGNGESIIFRNLGSSSYTVNDAGGNGVITVAPGLVYYVYLTDNSTTAGVWANIQFGAAASGQDAVQLAGNGLTVITALLNVNHPSTTVINDYDVLTTDRAAHFATTAAAGAFTLRLPMVATATNGFFFMFTNIGTGTVVIDPNGGELIDNQSTISIAPGESLIVVCSGSQWFSVGRGRSTTFVQSRLVKSVAGGVNVTLTTTEAGNIIQSYTGLLTANIAVIVPTAVAIYFPYNNTTGAFSLTVKTAAGSGVQVTQGKKTIVYCDGTNVVDADDETTTTSIFMADGSAPSPGLPFQADTDTGIWRPGNNVLGIAAGGVDQAQFDSSGVNVTGTSIRLKSADLLTLMLVYG